MKNILLQALMSFGSCWRFAICLNVPRKTFIASGVTGMCGWLGYEWCFNFGHSKVGSSLIGTIIIGIVGLIFARQLEMPVTIFTIPALMPLVPGGTAYEALKQLVMGHVLKAQVLTVHMFLIAGAIAIGFMIAQIFSQYYLKKVNGK